MKTNYFKEFARYTSLNVLGMIGLSGYILADTFFVARGLGSSGLAALNLALPVYSLIHGIGLMLGIGGATKYSINSGQSNYQKANMFFSQTVITGILFSIILTAVGGFFSGYLASLLGADAETFDMCSIYLKVLLLFAPFFIFNNIFISFIRNDGFPHYAMTAMICGSLANIVMDYIFIFPFNMGIFGAVLATGFSPIISLAIMSPLVIRKKINFRFVNVISPLKKTFNILSSGVPSLITELSSGIVIIVFNIIILKLKGNTGVAAYGIVANISLVAISIFNGIAQGVQPLLSRYYGLGKQKAINALLRYAKISAVGVSIVIYTLVFCGAEVISGIFNKAGDSLLQKIAVEGLRLYFIGCIFAGLNIIFSIYFTSTSKPVPAWIISMMRGFFVIIPFAFAFSYFWDMTGLWLVFPATEFLVFLITFMIIKIKSSHNKLS